MCVSQGRPASRTARSDFSCSGDCRWGAPGGEHPVGITAVRFCAIYGSRRGLQTKMNKASSKKTG